jgi:hypothetical protein
MERAPVRTRAPRALQRRFEPSRLQGDLIAAAYARAVPIRRQRLPTAQRPAPDVRPNGPSPTTPAGVPA